MRAKSEKYVKMCDLTTDLTELGAHPVESLQPAGPGRRRHRMSRGVRLLERVKRAFVGCALSTHIGGANMAVGRTGTTKNKRMTIFDVEI